jgi:hypothetical protein
LGVEEHEKKEDKKRDMWEKNEEKVKVKEN